MMPLQSSLSIERMCQLAQVSRAGFYRSLQARAPTQEDMDVRSTIQAIAVEHRRRYGYRRITAELRRRGMLVNHKRVSRIMREDNLLAVQPRAFVVTTDAAHDFEVFLNLALRCPPWGFTAALEAFEIEPARCAAHPVLMSEDPAPERQPTLDVEPQGDSRRFRPHCAGDASQRRCHQKPRTHVDEAFLTS